MKAEEARFILSSVRPGSAADRAAQEDPNIEEALRAMESDPQLKAWYEEHCRFDQAVCERVGGIDPPADLEATILAGLKVSRMTPWWRRPMPGILAAAAAVALFAAVGYVALRDSAPSSTGGGGAIAGQATGFQRTMVSEIQKLKQFDQTADNTGHLVSWLDQQGAPTLDDLELPSTVAGADVAGCKLLEWNGHRVSLLCFLAPDDKGEIHSFHLVMVDGKALDGIAEGPAQIATENGWSTAIWRQGSKVCLLATDNTDTAELRRQSEKIPLT